MDLTGMRHEYAAARLRRADLDEDPFRQFAQWFGEARDANVPEVNAMSLTTVAGDGQPSLRTVLLKYVDKDGFVFFTNYDSAKAREIAANDRVALLFFWPLLGRQVIVKGTAAKTTKIESARYFLRRPRGSQLGAWISQQSQVISSRALLEKAFAEVRDRFAAGEVPAPPFWGGYRVIPVSMEFWQGAPDRLHDRFIYRRDGDGGWRIERLAP